MITALLVIQVMYKITTPVTAGLTNRVAISNVVISAWHCVTLNSLWHERWSSSLQESKQVTNVDSLVVKNKNRKGSSKNDDKNQSNEEK